MVLVQKIIVVGDSGVGKTSLIHYLVTNQFDNSVVPTMGIEFFSKSIDSKSIDSKSIDSKSIDSNPEHIMVQIWDVAGQERFRSVVSAYYRNIDAAILCYDISNRESFENIPYWLDDIRAKMYDKNPIFILIGTKVDRVDRKVAFVEGQTMAESMGAQFYELSAKHTSVSDVHRYRFDEMFQKMVHAVYKTKQSETKKTTDSVTGFFARSTNLSRNMCFGAC